MNHGFYGLSDFTDFGGRLWLGFEVLTAGVLNQDLQDFEDFQVADFILYDAVCSSQISADYQLAIPSCRCNYRIDEISYKV